MNSNPLSQYFRQPAIFIRLPSGGKFYPPDTLEPTANHEYPVLPMTTIDEITYRTPDALFNGQAVVSVIRSCVPNIRDPWHMPGMDLDTVLVAIRIATYGHSMDIDSVCPKCEHEQNFALDLRHAMEQMQAPDYNQSIKQGDLEIFFRPMSYQQLNSNNLAQFEEQKALQIIENTDEDRENKMQQLSEILRKITDVTIKALAQSIACVQTPNGRAMDVAHIAEWLANCDRSVFNKIRQHIIDTKRQAELQTLKITCPACQHQHDQIYTLDMTSFFEDAS